jgi:hypothetical protein
MIPSVRVAALYSRIGQLGPFCNAEDDEKNLKALISLAIQFTA